MDLHLSGLRALTLSFNALTSVPSSALFTWAVNIAVFMS